MITRSPAVPVGVPDANSFATTVSRESTTAQSLMAESEWNGHPIAPLATTAGTRPESANPVESIPRPSRNTPPPRSVARIAAEPLPFLSPPISRPPIAMLGVPFDHVTVGDCLGWIETAIASGRPHYVVTANVDFLVQARADVELRRILVDAHLVLCDGTPLLWASKWLGNPLPERVAGAD